MMPIQTYVYQSEIKGNDFQILLLDMLNIDTEMCQWLRTNRFRLLGPVDWEGSTASRYEWQGMVKVWNIIPNRWECFNLQRYLYRD